MIDNLDACIAFSYFSTHIILAHIFFLINISKYYLAAANISEISWNIFLLTQCDINHSGGSDSVSLVLSNLL